jgi:hypothetical protein
MRWLWRLFANALASLIVGTAVAQTLAWSNLMKVQKEPVCIEVELMREVWSKGPPPEIPAVQCYKPKIVDYSANAGRFVAVLLFLILSFGTYSNFRRLRQEG